jgi:hypothetical protein
MAEPKGMLNRARRSIEEHGDSHNEEHGAVGKKWEMRKGSQPLSEAVAAEAP